MKRKNHEEAGIGDEAAMSAARDDSGLGEDPLADDPLLETLYAKPPEMTGSLVQAAPSGDVTKKRGRPKGGARKPLDDGQSYRLVTFSFYEGDVERLDALLAEAKKRGHSKASRSQIVRLALRQVDLDGLPDPI